MTVLRVDTIAGIGQTFGPLLDGDLEFNSQNFIVLPKGSSNQQGVLRTTEDVIGVGGTYYDNLVLALPLNEATQFKDVSSQNQVSAAITAVSIASTVSKFYGSSAYFNGNNNRMLVYNEAGNNTIPSNSRNLTPGNNDFTMEAYIRFNTLPGTNIRIFGNVNNGSYLTSSWQYIRFGSDGTSRLFDGSAYISTGADNFVIDTWYHIAVVRSGGVQTLYIDGTAQGTTVTNSNNLTYPNLDIGSRDDGAEALDGYMQDIRFYIGIAKYTANFTPPERIAEIGVGFKTGQLRYNTDSNKPELYDGNQWTELQLSSPALGRDADTGPGARGLFGGGQQPSPVNEVKNIDYINLSSGGTALDFGDLQQSRQALSSFGSSTRGFWAGGRDAPTNYDIIEFVTFSSTGNFTDFGNLSTVRQGPFGLSNSTRGIIGGGYNKTTIDYVTMSSTGDAQDFGDVDTSLSGVYQTGIMSPTRGVFNRSLDGSPLVGTKQISFVTIATLGDAIQFGDLQTARAAAGASSNAVRGIFFGGYSPDTSSMEHINMASTGNGNDFGDLLRDTKYNVGNCATPTRGFCAGGNPYTTDIQSIDLTTLGDAVKFGDLTSGASYKAGISNAHGGL
jgi:hypothetical protein